MRFASMGLIATGLSMGLAAGAGRPGADARASGGAEPVPVAEAGGEADEMALGPAPTSAPAGGGLDDRRGRPPFGDRSGRRGPGLRFRRPGPGPDAGPLPPEQVEKLMRVIREHFPKLDQRLSPLRTSNPPLFRRMLHRARGPISEIVRIMEHDPELAKKLIQSLRVEMELAELHKRYHGVSSESRREQIESLMRAELEKRFDLRLERLRLEIHHLERRLERAKQQLAQRESGKQSIIDEEIERLVTQKPERWPRPRGPRPPAVDRLPPPT